MIVRRDLLDNFFGKSVASRNIRKSASPVLVLQISSKPRLRSGMRVVAVKASLWDWVRACGLECGGSGSGSMDVRKDGAVSAEDEPEEECTES